MSLAVLHSVPPDIFIIKAEVDVFFTEAVKGYELPHKVLWDKGVMTFMCQDKGLHDLVINKVITFQTLKARKRF